MSKITMDKGINIAKLQLYRCVHAVESYNLGKIPNNLQAALQAPPVIIGKF